MSDQESDAEQDVLDDTVVNKYKMAAEVTNAVLIELIGLCTDGANIVELCELGDKRISEKVSQLFKKDKEMKKGVAFPTAISVNNIMCHYSPIDSEENDPTQINTGDLVKINVGAHVDGYAAIVGHTFVVGATQDNKITGRKADVILAAHTAAEAIMRLLKPGMENLKASEIVSKVVADFKCHAVEGMQCHQMKKLVYDAEKSIVFNPSEEQKKTIEKCTFDTNDVWNVDIVVSTGDGKPREHNARTTLYKKNETLYQLKMKASRQLYSEIANKFLVYPFNLRSLDDIKKARLGITECIKHGVIQPLSVHCEKDDEFVAQFRFTVLLMPNGPMKVTGLTFDPSLYKSEFKVKDAEIKDLLSQSVKIQNKKKKLLKPEFFDKNLA
uniref:Proliferation-associated protein 2G4 n=2 Tax=Schistosoma japonicum TaxID=6182 RepID=C1LJB6_SCHJA|nr:Proliferation-associated protein 2G4 [Schistosoma japonicum]